MNGRKIYADIKAADFDCALFLDENSQYYLCDFYTTDGAVIVSEKETALLTDSRYIEAAENDTPALVLEGTGSAERFVDGKTGFTAKPNEKSVAQKIAYLMDNKEELKSVGQRAYSVCIPWDDIVREYVDLYKEEIDKKAGKVNQTKLKECKTENKGVKEKSA